MHSYLHDSDALKLGLFLGLSKLVRRLVNQRHVCCQDRLDNPQRAEARSTANINHLEA